MTERLEITRDIAATPQSVYDAVADVTRMGEWSPECHRCEWHEGFDGPVVGATFDGHNRHGAHEWTTQGRVIEADPGRTFAFECSMYGVAYATWGYRIEPTASGNRVTEWTEDFRPPEAIPYATEISGVAERTPHNRGTMETTLDRLAAVLES